MIAFIAAVIMLGFFFGTYWVAYRVGVWVGKRGGTGVVLRAGAVRANQLNETRKQVTGGKHRGSDALMEQLLGR